MINDIKNKIEDAKSIIISGHINPDGDIIGSGLALLLGLEKKYPNKKIEFVIQDPIPKNIAFLKGIEKIKNIKDIKDENYDLSILVDSATLDRIGDVVEIIKDTFKINIDHHISNSKYGDINIVEDISSTSELMYGILEDLGIEITLEMGEAMYLGLVNDTGNFAHSNVSENTFKVAANLMKLGVNNNKIVNDFFKSKSLARLRILGKALSEMKFDSEKKLSYFYLPYEFLQTVGATKDETEGLVEELLNYNESEASLFLRGEPNGKIKGSLRSKHDKDVNAVAALFGGGGHIKAAGFASDLSAEDIIKKVVENI